VLEDTAVVEIMRAGATGYLLKDLDGEELCQAIHAAAAGRVQLAPAAAKLLLQELRPPERVEALTDREIDVLRLIGRGQSNKQIAQQLNLREETVKTHVSKVLHKLGMNSRTQAALYAMRSGLLAARE
jgi:NarL family two-component system response regulator LiaR